jgi:hypothetical protein
VTSPSPKPRPLTDHEAALVRWMLEHGGERAVGFIPQVAEATVVSSCPCGCASINFAIGGIAPPADAGMDDLSHFGWGNGPEPDDIRGVFVFACAGQLAGLEVWSCGDGSAPTSLPTIDQLHPLTKQQG